jgi:hypothetical protein
MRFLPLVRYSRAGLKTNREEVFWGAGGLNVHDVTWGSIENAAKLRKSETAALSQRKPVIIRPAILEMRTRFVNAVQIRYNRSA